MLNLVFGLIALLSLLLSLYFFIWMPIAISWKITMVQKTLDDGETPCPVRKDKKHCNCWYDSEKCCSCGEPAANASGQEGGGDE